MKKILFSATIAEHFYYFHMPYLEMFHNDGWEVHVASKKEKELDFCDKHHKLSISRSPFDKSNIAAYKKLKSIIKENKYDIIHCHTPVGGMLTRLAVGKNSGSKVIYTAHGFHFYKGAPLINWLIFYPIEYFMSFKTDCLITINEEDYDFAKKHFKHPDVKLVNGVGYNSEKFFPVSEDEKMKLREKKGFSKDDKILIYVAELNKNKNQEMIIRALKEIPGAKLLFAGRDNNNGACAKAAELYSVKDRVYFLDQRDDVDELLQMSDICAASSIREGLPVNIMEAMACGVPVVATDNRGHRSLVKNGEDGFTVAVNDDKAMAEKINLLLNDKELFNRFSQKASENIKKFSKENVLIQMKQIYRLIQR